MRIRSLMLVIVSSLMVGPGARSGSGGAGLDWSVEVLVTPSTYEIEVGETLDLTIDVDVTGEDCFYTVYEMTVTQRPGGMPHFLPDEVHEGPGVPLPRTLHFDAVRSGTTTFHVSLYGEVCCESVWMWTYESGDSDPITVRPSSQPSVTPPPTMTITPGYTATVTPADSPSMTPLPAANTPVPATGTPIAPTMTPGPPTAAPCETIPDGSVWIEAALLDDELGSGDEFRLYRRWGNDNACTVLVDEYCALNVYGEYWFAPSWGRILDRVVRWLPADDQGEDALLSFIWPDGVAAMDGLKFWMLFLRADSLSDLLAIDMIEWRCVTG